MKNFVAYFVDALVIVTSSILFLLLPAFMLACIIIEYKWVAVLCIEAFLAVVTIVAFILKKKDKLRKEKERQALK